MKWVKQFSLKVDISIDDSEDAPTVKEMKEALAVFLSYQNPHDFRRFIQESKVTEIKK